MLSQNSAKPLALMLWLLCAFPVITIGAENADASSGAIVVTSDGTTASTVTIDGPWDRPLVLEVITVSDVPAWTALIAPDVTPDQPQRIATVIQHPTTGEFIEINFVETNSLIINNERPFTRDAQWEAAARGQDIRVPNDGTFPTGEQAIGWWTGKPVVEIPVFYDSERPTFVNYSLRFLPSVTIKPHDHHRDRDRFLPVEDEGGDPGGNPDPPGARETDDGDDEEGGEGGDPGGNPDPPNQNVGE